MKSIRTLGLFKYPLAAALALCLFAGAANAQHFAASRGSFTLPFEVNWGTAVLPAGDYTFTLGSFGMSPILAIEKGSRPSHRSCLWAVTRRVRRIVP